MRILRWFFGLVVVLALVFVVGGLLMPRETIVSRAIMIDAPAEQVFPHVNSMKATEAWSPWLSRDPATELNYTGPDQGVGAQLDWASDNPQVGTGTQVIVESVENQWVKTALDFGAQGTASAGFLLEEGGGSTKVTWDLITDAGLNPMARWMGPMLDRWVGADYEKGLSNLKALVEAE